MRIAPYSEAQVDWYDAWASLSGERVKLQVFEMRSMASGRGYHRAYAPGQSRTRRWLIRVDASFEIGRGSGVPGALPDLPAETV